MRRRHGFTVIELLVALTVLAVLGLALVNIYGVSLAAFRQGSGRLQLQQRAREAFRRVAPLVVSAIPPNPAQDAIYSPTSGNSGQEIVFSSPYSLVNPSATPFDARNPSFVLHRIRFDGPSSELVLEEFYDASSNRLLARNLEDVEFRRLDQNSVEIRVEVQEDIRGAINQERSVSYELESVLQIPYYTSN